jgi:hypothetical protein
VVARAKSSKSVGVLGPREDAVTSKASLIDEKCFCPGKFVIDFVCLFRQIDSKSQITRLNHAARLQRILSKEEEIQSIAQKPLNFHQKQFCPGKLFVNCMCLSRQSTHF